MNSLRNRADVAQRQRIVQRQLSSDFLDHTLEWRRIFAEIWGTFLLVVVAAGGEVVASRSNGAVTPGMRAVAPGLMVMAIIYFMGAVSGAHLNPAVTLAFAVRRNFPWSRVPGYVMGQVVGGVLAALFLRVMFGTVAALGATVPGSGIGNGKALAMEVLLTTGLVNTTLGTASGARNIGTNGAIAVGGYIALGTLGSADHGRIDEPGEIVCAGFGARGLRHDVDLPGRPGHRRANRGDFRADSQGQAHSCGRDCGARCARRQ